jgi:hypothetical protein
LGTRTPRAISKAQRVVLAYYRAVTALHPQRDYLAMPAEKLDEGLRRIVGRVALLNLAYFGVEFSVALVIGSVSLFADSIDFLEDTSINFLIREGGNSHDQISFGNGSPGGCSFDCGLCG